MNASDHDAPVRLAPRVFDSSLLRRGADAVLALPVWAQALAVFLVSRIVSLAIFAAVLRKQPVAPWTSDGTTTTLGDFLMFWDAAWYAQIAHDGYPAVLPLTDAGTVGENPWAFYPLYPWLVRDLGWVLRLDYHTLAPWFSFVCTAGAAILVLVLFRRRTTPGRALMGLAVVLFFPASAILSTGYAESLTLLLQALALLLVLDRRYLWAIPVVFLMDLSRPIGVAFSFFMLIHLIDRFLRRKVDPYPAREVVTSWTLGVLSCVAALVHPALAALRTGSITAYTDTEAAWSGGHSRILVQWFARGNDLVGGWGPVLLFAAVAGMLALVYSPAGGRMGRTLQHFCLAYGIYILLFFNPQTSTLRLLLPLFPVALTLAYSRSWAYRGFVLAAFTMFQIVWVGYLWHFTPPSDFPP